MVWYGWEIGWFVYGVVGEVRCGFGGEGGLWWGRRRGRGVVVGKEGGKGGCGGEGGGGLWWGRRGGGLVWFLNTLPKTSTLQIPNFQTSSEPFPSPAHQTFFLSPSYLLFSSPLPSPSPSPSPQNPQISSFFF